MYPACPKLPVMSRPYSGYEPSSHQGVPRNAVRRTGPRTRASSFGLMSACARFATRSVRRTGPRSCGRWPVSADACAGRHGGRPWCPQWRNMQHVSRGPFPCHLHGVCIDVSHPSSRAKSRDLCVRKSHIPDATDRLNTRHSEAAASASPCGAHRISAQRSHIPRDDRHLRLCK